MLKDGKQAAELLTRLGAPVRLIRHAEQVSCAARLIAVEMEGLGVRSDSSRIEVGAILHDAGKIIHPEELSRPGSLHEQAGEALLLAQGVEPEIARYCVSHAQWDSPGASLEELTVALADKLWKGKRDAELELRIIDDIAGMLGVSRWEIFQRLDDAFEQIAMGGAERVQSTMLA